MDVARPRISGARHVPHVLISSHELTLMTLLIKQIEFVWWSTGAGA